jgi:hypothetical protein
MGASGGIIKDGKGSEDEDGFLGWQGWLEALFCGVEKASDCGVVHGEGTIGEDTGGYFM